MPNRIEAEASVPCRLTLPGLGGSGPDHWQSRWERLHDCRRVEQADWDWPKRGDWMARLDEVLLASPAPALLVAHSLGCHLVAAWASHSRHTSRVQAALLVAMPDTARVDMPSQLAGWRSIPMQPLPFRSLAITSRDDPYCTPERSAAFARAWGAEHHDAGTCGHLNADSGLGDWTEGWSAWTAWLRK